MTDNSIDLGFFLDAFIQRTRPEGETRPDVQSAIAVSADGLLVAASSNLPVDRADQLAAFAAALTGAINGGKRCLEAGPFVQNMVEYAHGCVLTMAVSDGASLLALVNSPCDIARVTHDMAELINKVGHAITPQARQEQFLSDEPAHPNR